VFIAILIYIKSIEFWKYSSFFIQISQFHEGIISNDYYLQVNAMPSPHSSSETSLMDMT